MKTVETLPGSIKAGVAILAASLVPIWLIDLHNAPMEMQIRFWTTALVCGALLGVVCRMSFFRWLLAALMGTGIVVTTWGYVLATTVEPESVLITVAQVIGLALFFTPAANQWFGSRLHRGNTNLEP